MIIRQDLKISYGITGTIRQDLKIAWDITNVKQNDINLSWYVQGNFEPTVFKNSLCVKRPSSTTLKIC